MGGTGGNTFAKLRVRALINDPPQKSYSVSTMTHDLVFDNTKFDLISNICVTQKKRFVHQLGPITYFLTTENLT